MGITDTVTGAAIYTTLRMSRKAEELITNNLANYDTPGYKSQTLSFRHQLKAAIQNGPAAIANVQGAVVTQTGSLRPDGNNVSMTGQMTALAQVQLLYQTAVQAFNQKTTEMKIVTEGRPQ